MRFSKWSATAEWYTALLVDRMEVNIGPAWYGTPEAGLFVTYTFMPAHLHTHTQSLRVRWPGRSPRLRAITGQKQGDDRHWAFDNVSICCVCHSDSRSMLLRAWEKHAVQAMQSYTPLMSWQKRELGKQNVMQIGLRSGKIWSLKVLFDYDTNLKYPNLLKFSHFSSLVIINWFDLI